MKNARRTLGVAFALLTLLGSGCGEGGEPLAEVFTVYGTLTSTTQDAGGRAAFLRLSAGGETLFEADTRFAGARADYVMRNVPAGSYTLSAFVDMDGDRTSSSGDLVAPGQSLSVHVNTRADIADEDWSLMP
jgi:hypothetical protein